MAKGWMSKDPSEMTARQQRRMQFMEKRGRGGRVAGQPTEMPQQTERQARRQRFLERKQSRQDRAVQDWRQSPQGLMDRFTRNLPSSYEDWATQQYNPNAPQMGYQPFEQPNGMQNPFGNYQQLSDRELYEMGQDPRDPNRVSRGPDGQTISTLIGFDNSPLDPQGREKLWQERLANPRPMGGGTSTNWDFYRKRALDSLSQTGGVAMPPRPDAQGVGYAVGGFAGQQMTQNPMDANPFAQSRNFRANPYGPVGSAPFRMRR